MTRKQENILEIYKNYLENIEEKSPDTLKTYMSSLRIFFKYAFDNFNGEKITLTEIKKIDVQMINDYKIHLKNEGYPGNTIIARFNGLISLYNFLAEEYELEAIKLLNQLSKIKKSIKATPKKREVLTEEEAIRLLQIVKNDNDNKFKERDFLAFSLFLANGLRLKELLNLKESDINIEDKKLYFTGETTKGSKKAELELRDDVIDVFKDYLSWKRSSKYSDNDYIFVSHLSKSEHLSKKQMQVIVKKYKTLAKIEKNITPHSLRATLATILDKNGASVSEIKEQLRHANIQTTGIYININADRMREVSNMNPLSF